LLLGALDLLVLKTLQYGPAHGWDIAQRIQQVSQDVFGGSRLDRFGVGCVGEQPEGEILQADRRRPETVKAETETWRLFSGAVELILITS
jgi:hypothetical protein